MYSFVLLFSFPHFFLANTVVPYLFISFLQQWESKAGLSDLSVPSGCVFISQTHAHVQPLRIMKIDDRCSDNAQG